MQTTTVTSSCKRATSERHVLASAANKKTANPSLKLETLHSDYFQGSCTRQSDSHCDQNLCSTDLESQATRTHAKRGASQTAKYETSLHQRFFGCSDNEKVEMSPKHALDKIGQNSALSKNHNLPQGKSS